jgi:23S rRNA (adenine-N6)-dimethyltransferase
VADAGVRPGDLVVDLGAGTGAVTRHLVERRAHVLAVELHPGRAGRLAERFPDVTVVRAAIADFRWPRRPFTVVANPPFADVSVLVRRLLDAERLVAAHLVVPVQVGQRWAGKRPDRVSHRRLPRSAFRPQAPVPTAVLHIGRR